MAIPHDKTVQLNSSKEKLEYGYTLDVVYKLKTERINGRIIITLAETDYHAQ